jgi:hypothetical protein
MAWQELAMISAIVMTVGAYCVGITTGIGAMLILKAWHTAQAAPIPPAWAPREVPPLKVPKLREASTPSPFAPKAKAEARPKPKREIHWLPSIEPPPKQEPMPLGLPDIEWGRKA